MALSELNFPRVDLTAERVGRAQARPAAQPQRNLSFVVGDLTQPRGYVLFDLIYSVDVFEHIEDDRAALAALAAALRPGGRLFIHTPLALQLHWLRRFDLDQCGCDDHVRAGYPCGELEEKALSVGLKPEAAQFTHGRWGTLAWEMWRPAKGAGWRRVLAWPVIRLLIALELTRPPAWGNCVLFAVSKPAQEI